MDEQLRQNIRRRWLLSLFELSHVDYQRRLWIEAAFADQIGDFSEAICQYFNDLNLEEGYACFLNAGFVTEQEAETVKEFHKELDTYISRPEKKTLSDKHILRDIEWIDLTKRAKLNWEQLKQIITDKEELYYMTSLEKERL